MSNFKETLIIELNNRLSGCVAEINVLSRRIEEQKKSVQEIKEIIEVLNNG